MPTITVTIKATPASSDSPVDPSASSTQDATSLGCPTSTATVLAALHADGDACTNVGERYTLAGADLACTKDRDGSIVWMTKSKADKLAADLATEKAAADAKAKAASEAAQQQAAQLAQQQAAQQQAKQAQQQAGQQQPASSVYYANCTAARAAGAAPLYAGQPGYRIGLDRDHDGVACER